MLLELCDVHGNERHPDRSLLLRAPDYICQIGRGSRSGGQELFPSDTNALFESRVMSREHALLHADPVSKVRGIQVQKLGPLANGFKETLDYRPGLDAWHRGQWERT